MKSKVMILVIILMPCFLMSQKSNNAENHLIMNPERISDISRQLLVQKQVGAKRSKQLFSVLEKSMSLNEKQALEFLLAYAPLNDLANYDGQFFLQNAQISLKAREEMLWGKVLPEDVYLHFVLPVRVNNENLDSFRIQMYPELKQRIKGMNMHDAALEINHWCHEKVTYKGSDERTSSPLSTMKYSFGRCGEESTFTVAALRTVGIPARQVYTPRWAHSDDNHAWVEVWVDGKWYFMGACEPEPELNMGWFAGPAARTMLVHTRAYGRYFGNEPVITEDSRYSELDLIENYAPAKKLFVKVLGENKLPVKDALVEFKLYNYSEFYTIAKKQTDTNGIAYLIAGLGDLLIWGSKESAWGFTKVTVDNSDTAIVELHLGTVESKSFEFDMIPPVEREIVNVSINGKIQNEKRLLLEDSIRACYMNTFKDTIFAIEFSKKLKLHLDSTLHIVTKSYGNWKEITQFLEEIPAEQKPYALLLLFSISEKDLRDTKATVLKDHLFGSLKYLSQYKDKLWLWKDYILSGRISSEMMVAWKKYLFDNLASKFQDKNKLLDPVTIKQWVEKNIDVSNNNSSYSGFSTPVGVYELRTASKKSRDIFFIAVCRTFGIPARLNPLTKVPEAWHHGDWKNFDFNILPGKSEVLCPVKLIGNDLNIKYYNNFTIAVIENGRTATIEIEEGKTLSDIISEGIRLKEGQYMLTTGNRLQNGSVLSNIHFFTIRKDKENIVNVTLRESVQKEEAWGKLNIKDFYVTKLDDSKKCNLSEIIEETPFVFIFIEADKEPSKHVMADIKPVKEHFEKWGGRLIILLQKSKTAVSFSPSVFEGLPKQKTFVFDEDNRLIEYFEKVKKTPLSNNLPIVISGDNKGNLFFFSKGYRIGVGEQLVKKLKN